MIYAHTWYTTNPNITIGGLGYPVWSLEVCPASFFEVDPFDIGGVTAERRRAGTLIHEFLHHTYIDGDRDGDADALPIRDSHGSLCQDADDNNIACYGPFLAHTLALNAPEHAIKNNDNYALYAQAVGLTYTEGLCDDLHMGLCFPSDCCGNGELDAGEQCDMNDFGGQSCADFGGGAGELICEADCQVDASGCIGCGNSVIDEDNPIEEECDGSDFGGETCETQGYESGDLICSPLCTILTDDCEGGVGAAPASYGDCLVDPEFDCGGVPEGCNNAPDAGFCPGGPCRWTDPTNRLGGQQDKFSDFHPTGEFMDVNGRLYRCEEVLDGPMTCVNESGWGVCKVCGHDVGETMLGCFCDDDDDCGLDLLCWGKDFQNGGFCWPVEGPPAFQCEQGACGQTIRDENDPQGDPVGEDGAGYCEHYNTVGLAGFATCQPERCNNLQAQICSESGKVCELSGGDDDCTQECLFDEDCQLPGWAPGMLCGPGNRCTF